MYKSKLKMSLCATRKRQSQNFRRTQCKMQIKDNKTKFKTCSKKTAQQKSNKQP